MKKFILLLSILSIGIWKTAVAQELPYDTTSKKIVFTEVVQVPGASKDLLYDRAMRTLKQLYPQAENKMAVQDKAGGKIVLNGFVRVIFHEKNGVNMPDPDLIKYRFTLLFKDGKYKYEITEFVIDRGSVPFHIERWREHNQPGDHTFGKEDRIVEKMEFVKQDIDKIIDRLKKGMTSDPKVEKKDW